MGKLLLCRVDLVSLPLQDPLVDSWSLKWGWQGGKANYRLRVDSERERLKHRTTECPIHYQM
jgi:hypothetical protein